MRKTKIICTLGPAVDSDERITQIINAGMDCARLNFSHGTHEEQEVRLNRVRRIAGELNRHIPILLDTKGPEIRLKDFEGGSVIVEKGSLFTFDTDKETPGTRERIGLTYDKLAKNVEVGTRILVDDGKIDLKVTAIKGSKVICKVVTGGKLSNHKSINIPNVEIPMPYLNDVDKSDLLFGIEHNVEYIAASFVRCADFLRITADRILRLSVKSKMDRVLTILTRYLNSVTELWLREETWVLRLILKRFPQSRR